MDFNLNLSLVIYDIVMKSTSKIDLDVNLKKRTRSSRVIEYFPRGVGGSTPYEIWVGPKLYLTFSRSEIVYQNSISILVSKWVSKFWSGFK